MIQLTPDQYHTVAPLFEPLQDHLAVPAALAGLIPAAVYADAPGHHGIALLHARHRLYLAGPPGSAPPLQQIHTLFHNTLRPQAQAAGQDMFTLWLAPADWAEPVREALADRRCALGRRHYYTFRALRRDWRSGLPPGFALQPVDAALLSRPSLAGLDDLRAEMCSERPSVDAFLAQSFGVCLTRDDALAGWCLSEYNIPGACEIGIETREPWRRRGLATVMASAFVETALARGVTRIGWDCWANNQASIATALKAGFEKTHDDPVIYGWFNN